MVPSSPTVTGTEQRRSGGVLGAARWAVLAAAIGGGTAFGDTQAVSELWFPVGESLEYTMYWGILPVGDARMWTEWVEDEGVRRLAIRLTAETRMIVSAIYPVDDFIEAIVDTGPFLPVRYTQDIREDRRVRKDVTVFDHAKRVATCRSEAPGRAGTEKSIPIDGDTRDVLSLMYYMRSKGFDAGQVERFRVLVDDRIYDLIVTGMRYEKIYLSNFGDVACLKLEPTAKFGEVFVRKGRVFTWFSADGRRLLARAVGKLPFADLKAILQRVTGPGVDPWVRPRGRGGPSVRPRETRTKEG